MGNTQHVEACQDCTPSRLQINIALQSFLGLYYNKNLRANARGLEEKDTHPLERLRTNRVFDSGIRGQPHVLL